MIKKIIRGAITDLYWRVTDAAESRLRKRAKRENFLPTLYKELSRPWIQALNIKSIVDIGANVGDWTKTSSIVFPEAKIYAFEPIAELCAQLNERMKDCAQRVQTFNVALAEKEGVADFYLNDFVSSSSLLKMHENHKHHFSFTAHDKKIQVPVKTLDSFFSEGEPEESILVKVDVQGAESSVLRGGRILFSKAKIAIMEVSFEELYEKGVLFDELNAEMKRLNFSYHGQLAQLHSPVNGRPVQADCIFVKNA